MARQSRRRRGREDLAGRGRAAQTRGLDDGRPEHVAVLDGHLARGDADPHREPRAARVAVRADRPLDRDAGRERVRRRVEGRHRAVAERLHHDAAVLDDRLHHRGVEVAPAGVERGVAEPHPLLGGSDEIAEQHRSELDGGHGASG